MKESTMTLSEPKYVLRTIKPGTMFQTTNSSVVYIKGHYDRGSQKYSVTRFDDVNAERFMKGSIPVDIDFNF
jgi:hypothetical protein